MSHRIIPEFTETCAQVSTIYQYCQRLRSYDLTAL